MSMRFEQLIPVSNDVFLHKERCLQTWYFLSMGLGLAGGYFVCVCDGSVWGIFFKGLGLGSCL